MKLTNFKIVSFILAVFALLALSGCDSTTGSTSDSALVSTPPVANAGNDQSVIEGESILLDGSASSDSNGVIVNYEWRESDVTLGSGEILEITLGVGIHTITLIVTDDEGAVDMDTIVITVNAISHNGITYSIVTSPYTGKVWLDRNIGAAKVCASLDDIACYGDYYQWGRNTDGHEKSYSDITITLATTINPQHGDFIAIDLSTPPNDWTSADSTGDNRSLRWTSTDASSVCPQGFRVPTITELSAETINVDINNSTDAFNSFLKLPPAGHRFRTGGMEYIGARGYYWTSTSNGTLSTAVGYDDLTSWTSNYNRSHGSSVRCIKN